MPSEANYLIRNRENCLPDPSEIPPGARTIIILRDFLNHWTSVVFADFLTQPDLVDYITRWKAYARGIPETPSGLVAERFPKALTVLYNRWLVDKNYRDEVARKLNIPNTSDDMTYIDSLSGKSSFIGVKTEPDKQQYFNRYKRLKLDKFQLETLTRDEELVQLNKALFGMDIREQLREVLAELNSVL
jgi:hypothetical protein